MVIQMVVKVLKVARHQVDYGALAFHHALDQNEPGVQHNGSEAGQDRVPDHHIGIAGFIFEGQENDSRGCTGSLATRDEAGHPSEAPVLKLRQRMGHGALPERHARAQRAHWVRAE